MSEPKTSLIFPVELLDDTCLQLTRSGLILKISLQQITGLFQLGQSMELFRLWEQDVQLSRQAPMLFVGDVQDQLLVGE
jgi:hypothetical protein